MNAWRRSHKAAPSALALADRHYSRTKPGSGQVGPACQTLVLVSADRLALWVSAWPKFRRDEWAGAWLCTVFRNEGLGLSSDLVRAAVAHTRAEWGQPPPAGMATFIDREKVRRKRDPGRCFLRAGFEVAGETSVHGLLVLRIRPERMPESTPVPSDQGVLL